MIDEKGRVTVPLEVRRHLGLAAGDKVEFISAGSRKHARFLKFDPKANPFQNMKGFLDLHPGARRG